MNDADDHVEADIWSAYAVALTFIETKMEEH
jgi:hypothetical protein